MKDCFARLAMKGGGEVAWMFSEGAMKGYTYMMMNKWNTVIYVGVTRNIRRRALQHRTKMNKCFTSRYQVTKLVYFEEYNNLWDAIKREKQLKAGSRAKKIALIKSINPLFRDLFDEIASGLRPSR